VLEHGKETPPSTGFAACGKSGGGVASCQRQLLRGSQASADERASLAIQSQVYGGDLFLSLVVESCVHCTRQKTDFNQDTVRPSP
jgi:hypothetical protein